MIRKLLSIAKPKTIQPTNINYKIVLIVQLCSNIGVETEMHLHSEKLVDRIRIKKNSEF